MRPVSALMADEPEDLTNKELEYLAVKLEQTIRDLGSYGDSFAALCDLLRYRLRAIYTEQHNRTEQLDLTVVDFNMARFLTNDLTAHDLGDTIRATDNTICGLGEVR
jgi:hypothetical protein